MDDPNAILNNATAAIVRSEEAQDLQAKETPLPAPSPPVELARPAPKNNLTPEQQELLTTARILHESGLYGTVSIAECYGKIWTGRQLGVSDLAALTGITKVKRSINYHYMLYGTKINLHPTYSFTIVEHTDDVCQLDFYDGEKLKGSSRFTIADAKRAGLLGGDNWRNYPKNMLYARAMANGIRFIFPDLIGAPLIEDNEVPEITNKQSDQQGELNP